MGKTKVRTLIVKLQFELEQKTGRRWQQQEIAKAAGVSVPLMIRWQNDDLGSLRTETLVKFKQFFEAKLERTIEVGDILYFGETGYAGAEEAQE